MCYNQSFRPRSSLFRCSIQRTHFFRSSARTAYVLLFAFIAFDEDQLLGHVRSRVAIEKPKASNVPA
ncbi:hypothetical protein Y032_0002g1051 [Ancylostoma ceylanicum]|uniref:Uncharacterized protein n=1 Tax=Ancylostoma ceylanicum TaxID=53326 RepID=A0A016VYM8_9BILA|nr:hypothetical protein Y032_0002g1051 [Ancylostoma ceylanicum]